MAERCRADGWSASIIKCLRDARDEEAQEPCLHALSPEQQARLKAAFAPIDEEYAAARTRDDDLGFQRQLDELHVDQLAARAAPCADYVAAISAARTALLGCAANDELKTFYVQNVVLGDVRGLLTIQDDAELAAACAREATALRAMPELTCKPRVEK